MPFSNPSYFGPARATDRIVGQNAGLLQTGDRVFLAGLNAGANSPAGDLIVIGSSALDAGAPSPNGAGIIAIGVNALTALTSVAQSNGANVAIGRNIADSLVELSRSVLMGTQVMMNITSSVNASDNTVAIGYRAGSLQNVELTAGAAFVRDSVLIGYEAGRRNNGAGTNEGTTLDDSVMIGHQAGLNYFLSGSSNRESSVIIGQGAGANGFGSRDVIIGKNALTTTTVSPSAGSNVLIGSDSTIAGTNVANNVVIGYDAATSATQGTVIGSTAEGGTGAGNVRLGYACADVNTAAGQGNVLLGAHARLGSGTGTGMERNIVIGYGAGRSMLSSNDDMFMVEILTGGNSGTLRRMFYGNLATGNLIIGNAADADRNWRGTTDPTNAVKLVDGTVGTGSNPTNGGFLYSSGGALHWFGSAGTDTVIAPA